MQVFSHRVRINLTTPSVLLYLSNELSRNNSAISVTFRKNRRGVPIKKNY